jgi:hypothetical protein
MEDSQKVTKEISPGVLIDEKLLAFFFDREIDTDAIRKLIFAFEKHDLEVEYDELNHTFKFTVLKK